MSDTPTILMIGSDADLRLAFSRTLRAVGYEVAEAATGEEALALARARPPELVLLTASLPETDAGELCGQLKALPELSDTFVLFVSEAAVESDEQAEGAEGVADGYLSRSTLPHQLVAGVEAFTRVRRAETRLRASGGPATADRRLTERATERQRAEEGPRQEDEHFGPVVELAPTSSSGWIGTGA